MANTEPKTEADNPEQQPTAPPKSKTCFLRVYSSCQCQGCQKKVKKIIDGTPGFKVTDVDKRQQKVTVNVTENIHPDAVIQKLLKEGKKAELLWLEPDKPVSVKEKKQGKAKDKEKANGPTSLEDGKEEKSVKTENWENQEESKGWAHKDDTVIEMRKTKKNVPAGDRTPAVEESPVTESAAGPGESSASNKSDQASGNSGKKKKSKGQNGNNKDSHLEQHTSDSDATIRYGSDAKPIPDNGPANRGLPHQHMNEHPAHPNYATSSMVQQYPTDYYYGPPASAVNYHTTYPTSSYAASYYAPQPPQPHSSYASMHPGLGPCPVPGHENQVTMPDSRQCPVPGHENQVMMRGSVPCPVPGHENQVMMRGSMPCPVPGHENQVMIPGSRPYPVPGHENQVMMPRFNPYLARQPSSFELFSDENPNACSIM